MPTNEEITKTSLQAIAGAAVSFPPFGTVASAAIMGGLAIYDTLSALEAAEKEAEYKQYAYAEKLKIEALIDDVYKKARRRPRVPLDLYSAPPMYWIFSGSPSPVDKQSFRVPGGSVNWPSSTKGGSTFYETAGFDPSTARISNLYAPFSPKSVPKLCVFFWSVPLFFARLQEKFGEIIFGSGHNPQDKADFARFGSKTKDEVAAEIMKGILYEGEFDAYGNWYASIGPSIPPLAASDNEFAARYYGRQLWAHNIAKEQISYSDGTALCDTSVIQPESQSSQLNQRIRIAKERRLAAPRTINVPGSPYGNSMAFQTPVDVAGQLMDLKTLLSKYYIDDDQFRAIKSDGGVNVTTSSDDDQYLYYVTVVDGDGKSSRPNNYNASVELCSGSQLDVVCSGIEQAGPFCGYYSDYPDNSQFFKGLNLCPFQYEIAAQIRAGKLVTGASVATGFSSNGFYDFDQMDDRASAPGLKNVVDAEDFLDLRRISLTPMPKRSSSLVFCDAISESKYYFNLTSHDARSGNESLAKSMRSAYAKKGISATNFGDDGSVKIYTASMMQFQPAILKKKVYADIDKKSGNAVTLYSTGSVNAISPPVYPIVKLRPPLSTEKNRVWLPESLYGEALWAKRAGWDEFALANPQLPAGKRLAVFRISLADQSAFYGKPGLPKIATYFRSSLDENKPIVYCGKATPSPFYCGRKADGRTWPAWKQVRDATSNFGKPSKSEDIEKDTGWEDCHDWSWPYPTKYLDGIGKVSAELCSKYGEGIGRCGLSPSAVATGPTLWGDLSLFNKTLTEIVYNHDPKDPDFINTKSRVIWESLIEVQVGANTRYGYRTCEAPKSYTQIIEATYGIFSNSESSFKHYLEFANKKKEKGVTPKIWIPEQQRYQELTPDQAAQYCVKVIDKWYREMVPVPNKDHNDRYLQSTWSFDLLKSTAEAHIQLKNWAISRNKFPFPKTYYSINTLTALNVKNRIIQYNPFFLQQVMPVYSSRVANAKPQEDSPKISSGVSTTTKIVASTAIALGILYAVYRSKK